MRIIGAKALDDIDNTFGRIQSKVQSPFVALRTSQSQTRTKFRTEIKITQVFFSICDICVEIETIVKC